MPTSPAAIHRFLEQKPPTPIAQERYRGIARDALLADIAATGDGQPLLSKTEPYQHQLEGLAFACEAERGLLLFEMRTGKTLIALDWLSYLIYSGQLTKKALVIAHAPIGADEWEHQAAQHSYLRLAVIRSGPDSAERFMRALDSEADVLLTAWSTLQQAFSALGTVTRGSKAGREKLYPNRPLLRQASAHLDAVVIDEIHMAAHYNTLRFAIASELVAGARWRLGLTGTPFGRDPLLLWGQSYLIDGGAALGRSFFFFREAFCTRKLNYFSGQPETFDKRKLPLLREKLQATALTCELRDVQDVNVLKGVVRLTMSDEQAQAYDEAVDRLVKLRMGDTVAIDATFVRLRQIASGFLPFETEAGKGRIVDWPDAAKFVWLDDFLEHIPAFQIVIFCEFIHTLERIAKLLAKHEVSHDTLRGGTPNRPQLLERFRSGETQVLVANVATGGLAIDLAAADYLLFFESPASVITRRQAEARPLARGSRPLVLDDLVCAPIEDKLLAFLAQGEGLRDALLRDPRLGETLRR